MPNFYARTCSGCRENLNFLFFSFRLFPSLFQTVDERHAAGMCAVNCPFSALICVSERGVAIYKNAQMTVAGFWPFSRCVFVVSLCQTSTLSSYLCYTGLMCICAITSPEDGSVLPKLQI